VKFDILRFCDWELTVRRIKDWLYGITHTLPEGDETTIADADTPAEELRSVYHAVTWQKEIGGAGITPGFGKWENVTASFPLHDQEACADMLRQWSRKTVLTTKDLDAIRALFGEKVCFGAIGYGHNIVATFR
jgi:hypothetical protein